MANYQKAQSFWLLVLPTIVLFYVALFLGIYFRYPDGLNRAEVLAHVQAFSILYIFWLLIFFSHNLFDFTILRRYTSVFFTLLSAHVIGLIAAIVYFYLQPALILTPRRFLVIDVSISFLLLLLWYLLVKMWLARMPKEPIYLFSFTNDQQQLEKEIIRHGYLGFDFQGYLQEADLNSPQKYARSSIVFPDEILSRPDLLIKFYELRKHRVGFYNQHDFYEQLTRKVDLSLVSEFWFLANVNYQNRRRLYNLVKRGVDVLFGFFMLLVFGLTWPVIALAIKITSAGPLFFLQLRVGQNGELFQMYKYRTMHMGPGNTWTLPNDPRITVVGKFLRRFRLDELPQSFNLLRGNLSLVGPRPEQAQIVEMLKPEIPFYDERHLVKPGLTGWAQLNVYASSLEETKIKLQYDLYYIKHQSILFDLEIILKTAYHVVANKGR